MEQSQVLDLTRQAILVSVMVSAPILTVALFLGLAVSVFQAITQVQEMTLTYVPKLIGVGVVMAAFGGWMLTTLVSFTHLCFEHASQVAK